MPSQANDPLRGAGLRGSGFSEPTATNRWDTYARVSAVRTGRRYTISPSKKYPQLLQVYERVSKDAGVPVSMDADVQFFDDSVSIDGVNGRGFLRHV